MVDHVARLPWWAWVALALAAGAAVALLGPSGGPGTWLGMFVAVPLAAAACLSAWQRRAHVQRAAAAAPAPKAPDPLEGMPWRQFEVLICESFRLRGFQVAEVIGGGTGHSFDLVLHRHKRVVLAHCRPARDEKIADEIVRELDARRSVRGAAEALLLSAGRFSRGAIAAAKDRRVTLIGGSALRSMIGQVRSLREAATANARNTPARPVVEEDHGDLSRFEAPGADGPRLS